MNKALILIFLFSITACKVIEDKYLYDKNSDAYPALEAAAAAQCIAESPIFSNLKPGSFNSYPAILFAGNYIQISEEGNYFIRIDSITTSGDSLEFSVIPKSAGGTHPSYLSEAKYSITYAQNEKIVDLFAKGTCNNFYGGDPKASSSQLIVNTSRFYILDSTNPSDFDATPDVSERRYDQFEFKSDKPAFLFLWTGKFSFFTKAAGETEDTGAAGISLVYENANSTTCPSVLDDAGRCSIAGAATALVINFDDGDSNDDIDTVRSTSANSINHYYYNNFSI